MRDALVFMLVMGSLPIILSRPWIGILVWSWLGYMSPHRLTWGFAYTMPFAAMVGAVTLLSVLFYKGPKKFPVIPVTIVWFSWIFWMNLTTIFARYPASAFVEWDRAMKIQLFSVLTVMLIRSREQVIALVAVITASLGFFGLKGGLFSILTGGNNLVWGPPGSFIEDNNALGLCLVMIMPLLAFMVTVVKDKRIKLAFIATIGFTLFAILGTHSRGALLALSSMGLVLWFFSSHKIAIGIVMVMAAMVLWNFMPEHWHERMATIGTYQSDTSAMGRINAWWFAYYYALDHPFVGGGFNIFSAELFLQYAPDPEHFQDSHSIYFEVLGEHGFVGLGLFLLLAFTAIFTNIRTIFKCRGREGCEWIQSLARALIVSICGYLVGGAFLGLASFDLYYHLISLTLILRMILAQATTSSSDLTRVSDQLEGLDVSRSMEGRVQPTAIASAKST